MKTIGLVPKPLTKKQKMKLKLNTFKKNVTPLLKKVGKVVKIIIGLISTIAMLLTAIAEIIRLLK